MRLHNSLEVYVEIDGTPVKAGTLGASFVGGRSLGSSWFRYDPSYFKTAGAYEIDPNLPQTHSRTYSGEDRRLFGAFQDLTPDDWGRRVIDADLANIRAADPTIPHFIDEFDYLALTSDETRLGAIRFRAESNEGWLGASKTADLMDHGLEAYARAAARLEAHEATPDDLELLGAPGTSAGGARPKVTVYVDGKLRLIKLPSERDRGRDGEAWEYVAIQLARNAGINIQSGELLTTTDGKSSLILDRFDRDPTGQRIGFISARTAMGIGDQDPGRMTYEDLADTTDSLTGGDRSQLRDLFKRVALTVLINNVDDHWKNHGFLRDDRSWKLSPAFDVNPSTSRGSVTSRPVSPKDDPRQRDIRNLASTAATYALSSTGAGQALAEVLTAVQNWREVAHKTKLSADEISQMAGAFSEQQQNYAKAEVSRLEEGTVFVDLAPPAADRESSPAAQLTSEENHKSTTASGGVWVKPHSRGGRFVEGFWRDPPTRG